LVTIFGKDKKMKTSYATILVLVTASLLSTAVLQCRAAEDVNKEQDSIWLEDTAIGEHGRPELTAERTEHIMAQLAKTDPNKAEQLKQLQQEDPEKFKAELKKVMREQFGKKFKEHMGKRPEPFGLGGMPGSACNVPSPVMPSPNGMPMLPEIGMQRHGEPFGPGHIMPEMGMNWRYDKYLDWLKENYPDVAKQLEEARKHAEQNGNDANRWREYWKQFGLSLKKYGRIAEAARENPRLAEVLKKDLELRLQQDKLLGEIEAANDKDKDELIKDLKEVINNRFDVIVERKQIEYEQLLEKLERLKNDVEQRKAKMEKWKDTKFKEESVKARLEELLGKSDKFTW
jgi:hypothetical protein